MGERKPLGYGAARHVPDNVTAAWGARLIWPADLVWDRQGGFGSEAERVALGRWLNGGPLNDALDEARILSHERKLRQRRGAHGHAVRGRAGRDRRRPAGELRLPVRGGVAQADALPVLRCEVNCTCGVGQS